MPPIRNSAVARGNLAASSSIIVYTVPAANVLLLKNVLITNQSAAASVCYVIVNDNPPTTGSWVWQGSVAANSYVNVQTWVPCNANDLIVITAGAGAVSYWLGGALLPFVPGF